jgi:hypothetical protein
VAQSKMSDEFNHSRKPGKTIPLRKSKVIYIQRKHHRGSKLEDSEVLFLYPTGLHTALNRIMRIFLTYIFSLGDFEFSKIVCNYLSLGIVNYILDCSSLYSTV